MSLVHLRRAVNDGEVGAYLSHRAAWEAALGAPWTLILEDDVIPVSYLPPQASSGEQGSVDDSFLCVCSHRWASVWGALQDSIAGLRREGPLNLLRCRPRPKLVQ